VDAPRHPTREQIQLDHVLTALGNPVRLLVVIRLARGVTLTCGEALPEIGKSTASHHWRVLRESGVMHARPHGRSFLLSLRREDLDAKFPGLLDAVLAAAPDEAATVAALQAN
jgi:DNA-binding transcriptional ArsR family regulator